MNCFRPQNSEENPLILLNRTNSSQNMNRIKMNEPNHIDQQLSNENMILNLEQRVNSYQEQMRMEQEQMRQNAFNQRQLDNVILLIIVYFRFFNSK